VKENERKRGERALDKLFLIAALVLFTYGVYVFLIPISTKFSVFGIGAACIIFGLIALGLRFQKYRFKLIAIVVGLSLIVPAYFIEFSLFVFSQLSTSPARQIEPRTKREYLFSVNKGDGFQNAIPSVPPSTQLAKTGNNQEGLLPLAGIANRLTVHCNENGYWMTYQSDMHGFNNPNNRFWDGLVSVAVVGDSFAQGNCVQEGEDIASILRHRGEELGEVLNLGYGGNGPLLTLAVVREYVSLLRPAHVVWIFYEDNDADDLLKEAANPLLKKYLSDSTFSQRLVNRQEEINRRLEGQLSSE